MNYMVFSILPTLVEITMIAGILLARYEVWFAVITFVAVVVYIAFTMFITEWRMKYRVAMNAFDSKANTQAIDSLLNYETVKYFRQRSPRTAALRGQPAQLGGRGRQEPDLAVGTQFRPGGDHRHGCDR